MQPRKRPRTEDKFVESDQSNSSIVQKYFLQSNQLLSERKGKCVTCAELEDNHGGSTRAFWTHLRNVHPDVDLPGKSNLMKKIIN